MTLKWKFWAPIAALTLATSLVAPVSTPEAVAAPSMAATPIVAATTMPALAESVAIAIAPASGVPVYVAPPSDSVALVQAAANAATVGGIALVAPPTFDAATFKQTLSRWPVGEVRLVGTTGVFPPAFVSGLQPTYTVNTTRVGSKRYQWSEAAVDTNRRADIVVANNNVAGSVTAASAAAVQRGASLIIMDSGTDPVPVASLLNSSTVGRITTVGGIAAFPHPDLLTQETVNKMGDYPLTTVQNTETAAIYDAMAKGANGRLVVVSADSNADSVALAALYAKSAGAVLAVGGRGATSTETASKHLRLLRAQRTAMTLVGVKATTTLRTSFLNFGTVTTQATPAYRTTGTLLGSGNHTVTVTAVSGATTYRAYDASGAQIGTSTTSTITVTGVPRPLEIRALSSTGAVLATLQYKVSEYAVADDRPAAMASSTVGSVHHLVFLGTASLPRLVTRVTTDPLNPTAAPTTTQVVITCSSTFTDTGQSTSREHQYTVVTLSHLPKACGATTAGGEARVMASGITMPATALGVAANTTAKATQAASPRATQTRIAHAIAAAKQPKLTSQAASAGPGDGWPPIYFRYNGFIPESKVFGGLRLSGVRPYKYFHGDGRWYDPNGSRRFGFTSKVSFGAAHAIEVTKNVGVSIGYACAGQFGTDCVEVERGQAPDSGLSTMNVSSGATTADFTLVVNAANPLVSIAPPANAGVAFHLRPGGTTVRGIHDRYPVHEIYFYVEGWNEWETVYRSDAWSLPCLAGYMVAPGCEAKFSVLL